MTCSYLELNRQSYCNLSTSNSAGFIATVKNTDTHSQVDENEKSDKDNWLFARHWNVRDGDFSSDRFFLNV